METSDGTDEVASGLAYLCWHRYCGFKATELDDMMSQNLRRNDERWDVVIGDSLSTFQSPT